MKRLQSILMFAAVLLTCALAVAQSGPATSVQGALDKELSSFERHVTALAEAMPEDKYNFRPTAGKFDGVMDFAGQVKHVAGGFNFYAAAILGEKPPSEEGDANLKTKAQMLQNLKESFAHAHKAIASLNEKNMFEPIPPPFGKEQTTRLSLAISMVAHPYDHYGQMVEYLRGTGNVPPGSK
ncbi:MAG TPA: DinB family protein [Candidatus Koribacter sp.]